MYYFPFNRTNQQNPIDKTPSATTNIEEALFPKDDHRATHNRHPVRKRARWVRGYRLCSALFFALSLALSSDSVSAETQIRAFLIQIKNTTDHRGDSWTFGEGVWVLHDQKHPLFKHGEQLYENGMQVLIEQGKAHEMLKGMTYHEGVVAGARFPKRILRSGEKQSFVISALPGQRFSFAVALLETDDKFLAPMGEGIALFDFFKKPLSLTATDQIHLWDGGSAHDRAPQQNVVRGKTIDMRLERKMSQRVTTNTKDADSTTRIVKTGDQPHHDGYRYPHVETILLVSIKAL